MLERCLEKDLKKVFDIKISIIYNNFIIWEFYKRVMDMYENLKNTDTKVHFSVHKNLSNETDENMNCF